MSACRRALGLEDMSRFNVEVLGDNEDVLCVFARSFPFAVDLRVEDGTEFTPPRLTFSFHDSLGFESALCDMMFDPFDITCTSGVDLSSMKVYAEGSDYDMMQCLAYRSIMSQIIMRRQLFHISTTMNSVARQIVKSQQIIQEHTASVNALNSFCSDEFRSLSNAFSLIDQLEQQVVSLGGESLDRDVSNTVQNH